MSKGTDNDDQHDPVAHYYVVKKGRYLKDPNAAAAMVTGTPHDWEDAQGYAKPVQRKQS